MARRGQQARALEKKRLILDAAAELMQEDGLRNVTHRQVAARAGVPVGSIGYYYNTREELVGRTISTIGERRHARAIQLIRQASDSTSPEQAADLLLEVMLGACVSATSLRSWVTTGIDCTREFENLREYLCDSREQLREDITEALAATGFSTVGAESVIVLVAGAVFVSTVGCDHGAVEMARGLLIERLQCGDD